MTKVIMILNIFFLTIRLCAAQDTISRVITVTDLFSLAELNSKQLEISRMNIAINAGRTEVIRSQRLPEIGASAEAGYLSTIAILNPDFSWYTNVKTPHFTNTFALEASEIIYKGGTIRHAIERGQLAGELASFTYDKDKQDIKILLLGKYLDLFQLYNGKLIYQRNIELASKRLKDLTKLKEQGLVTQNDVLRNELQIADFQLDLDDVENNIIIINDDLRIVLGLPANIRIVPDTTLINQVTVSKTLLEYKQTALTSQPAINAARVNEKIAGKNVDLEKSGRLPELSLYAGDALQRPFLFTLEPLDIYYNAYQFGIKLKYNISSIYHAKDKIKVAKMELEQQHSKTLFQQQQIEIEVNTAFTRYREAQQRYTTLKKSLELADDNFRVVQKKYINQLTQITDMLDASTAKLSAELRLSNSRISMINQWYRLQKAAGNF